MTGPCPIDDRELQRFANANGLDWRWGGGIRNGRVHVWIRVEGGPNPIWISSESAEVPPQDLFIQVLGWVRDRYEQEDADRRRRVEALRAEAPYQPRR